MSTKYDIGFEEALSLTMDRLFPRKAVAIPVDEASGFAVAVDCRAVVDCPSVTASLKDGYAVMSKDVRRASRDNPVKLRIKGMIGAGDDSDLVVKPGQAVKVMTGATVPRGAEAVVAEEFAREERGWVVCRRDAEPGRNILTRGSDVVKGSSVAVRGNVLTPALAGLLAAAGVYRVQVFPRPKVGIISTGDEVVAPGKPLKPGQLYASNLVTLLSWLRHFRMEADAAIVPDQKDQIRNAMEGMLEKVDVLLTSGGAWKSERDMTTQILVELGGEVVFHRVRLGPGKAVALILVGKKVVFCLPGGPPSNEMAFLQIALPGLLHMSGKSAVPFGTRPAILTAQVKGDITWTQFFQAKLEKRDARWWAHPMKMKSRLQSQAAADALIKVPEGVACLDQGDAIDVQVLI